MPATPIASSVDTQGAQRAAGAGQSERARRGTRVRRVQQLAGTGHREQRTRGEERPAREGRDVVRAQTGPPHMRNSEAVAGARNADPLLRAVRGVRYRRSAEVAGEDLVARGGGRPAPGDLTLPHHDASSAKRERPLHELLDEQRR